MVSTCTPMKLTCIHIIGRSKLLYYSLFLIYLVDGYLTLFFNLSNQSSVSFSSKCTHLDPLAVAEPAVASEVADELGSPVPAPVADPAATHVPGPLVVAAAAVIVVLPERGPGRQRGSRVTMGQSSGARVLTNRDSSACAKLKLCI